MGGEDLLAFDLSAKATDEPIWKIDFTREKGGPNSVLSADGKRVVIEFSYGQIEAWDGPKGEKLHSWNVPWYILPGSGESARVALSRDGKRLAVSSREKTGLVGGNIYDLDSGKSTTTLTAAPVPGHGAMLFGSDGKKLYRSYQTYFAVDSAVQPTSPPLTRAASSGA